MRRPRRALPLVALCFSTACRPLPVTLAAAGDLHLGGAWKSDPLRALPALLDGDLRFLNLEGPLTDRGRASGLDAEGRPDGSPVRLAAPAARAAWLAGRADVVSIENNHALDQGEAGRDDTLRNLAGAHVAAVDGRRALRLQRRGRTLVFLARHYPPDADLDAQAEIIDEVARIRSEGTVIVSLHWGHTGDLLPTPEQRALAHRLVDAGAAAVLGHGPHTLQGIERRGRGVIAYSLGNLAFGCRCTDVTDAYTLSLRIDPDGAVSTVSALPVAAGLLEEPKRLHDPGLLDLIETLSRDLGSTVRRAGDRLLIESAR